MYSGGVFLGLPKDGVMGQKVPPPPKIFCTHSMMMHLSAITAQLINHVRHRLGSADISNFTRKFSFFRKIKIKLHFDTQFWFVLTFMSF